MMKFTCQLENRNCPHATRITSTETQHTTSSVDAMYLGKDTPHEPFLVSTRDTILLKTWSCKGQIRTNNIQVFCCTSEMHQIILVSFRENCGTVLSIMLPSIVVLFLGLNTNCAYKYFCRVGGGQVHVSFLSRFLLFQLTQIWLEPSS